MKTTEKVKNCAACGDDLLKNGGITFTIKDKPEAYCSRRCRATVTGEEPRASAGKPEPPAAVAAILGVGKGAAKEKKAKATMPVAAKAVKKETKVQTPPKTRSSSAPWSNMDGKLYLTDAKRPNFQGKRKQVFEMIKNGMKVKDLYSLCEKAGVECRDNLSKIIGSYGCAEVR